jgi:L-ascorbate metabolism protein UlaG (beta-lactamase superfamily)
MGQKIFGKLPSGERLERIQQSPQYKDGAFSNFSPTPVMAEDSSFWKTLHSYLKKPKDTRPASEIPSIRTDLHGLPDVSPVLVWFGHSSYLLRINGLNILVDPVFSGNAAPVSFMVKAYPGSNVYGVNDMPNIDVLLLTHDHYDHLDYITIAALKPKVKKIITSLGVGSHFEYWGFDKNIIAELDWWNEHPIIPGVQLTAAPARHFSGRGLKRGKTLWSSFILKTQHHIIYLGGDSGYDSHFKTIGNQFGPFDLAILESGQYNKNWPHIHMMPEQTVQAGIDLQAKLLLPVHWGKFTLSLHPWNEPVKRVIKKASELHLPVTTPMIGEPVVLDTSFPVTHWWEF